LELEELLEKADAAREGGDFEGAACLYEQALIRNSSSVRAGSGMGICLQNLGRIGLALQYLSRVATQGTEDPSVFVSLGNCYFTLGKWDVAIHAFRKAVAFDPHPARSLVSLAHALVKKGEAEEAESCLLRAIELEPGLAPAYDLMAFLLPEMGRFSEAKEFARTACRLDPQNPTYCVRFVYAGKVTAEDREYVDRLQAMSTIGVPNVTDSIRVEYGLGKALEDLERYEESLRHYVKANALAGQEMSSRGQGFDATTHRREVDYLIEAFSEPKLRDRAAHGVSSELPVFIVGMMRSGTTLTEQILSCHPEVGGAGELDFWVQAGPQTLNAGPAKIRDVGNQYVQHLEDLRPGNRRVIDKMPQNYMSLGPIHSALPNARIIHCRRDARDTCLSIFTVPFAFHPPFAYSFKNLAFTYKQYERIMDHWRSVLPPDRFIEIDYEELVADQEGVTRRLIEFLGLEWDESCMFPERNNRLVTTPSRWQVRQPVYKKSVGRWKKFAQWLEPMLEDWDCANDI